MCFSPQADLVGGLRIVAIGIDVARNVWRRRDHLAFAALPLLFGAHQLPETFAWWGLQGHVASQVEVVTTWIYVLFAFVFLPTYVALAIRALEPSGQRRNGYRHIAIFGVTNLIAVTVISRLAIDDFASVWCGWAALTSIAIAAHIRFGPRTTVARAHA